jgi:hypothetical protein
MKIGVAETLPSAYRKAVCPFQTALQVLSHILTHLQMYHTGLTFVKLNINIRDASQATLAGNEI